MSRPILLQNDLPFFGDRFDQIVDDGRELALDDRIGERAIFIYRVELALEVLFEEIVVIDAFDGAFEDGGLLFGEMDQLGYILEMGRFLVQTDMVVILADDESGGTEGIDVTVDGTALHLKPFGQIVDRIFGVCREHLHQTQQPFEFGLVHSVLRQDFACHCTLVKLVKLRSDLLYLFLFCLLALDSGFGRILMRSVKFGFRFQIARTGDFHASIRVSFGSVLDRHHGSPALLSPV